VRLHPAQLGAWLALSLAAPAPEAAAQRVSADVFIGGYPLSGHVRIGEPAYYPPRVLVVEREPEVVVVERGYGRPRYHDAVFLFYDPDYDRYYNAYRPGLEEVRVYADGGRYYQYDDYRGWRDRDRRYWHEWQERQRRYDHYRREREERYDHDRRERQKREDQWRRHRDRDHWDRDH